MDIITITVCVDYEDILKHMLKQNSKFFKIWYIVTSPDDKRTISLIEEAKIPNVQLLYFDHFFTNARFNKGGAIKLAQEHIDKNHTDTNILILDADIYLPDNFKEKLIDKLEDNTLYGVDKRFDYYSLYGFLNNEVSYQYDHCKNFVGFFQLYKQCALKYENSENCGGCDNNFKDMFPNRIRLDITVKHLGRDNINWYGRNVTYEKY